MLARAKRVLMLACVAAGMFLSSDSLYAGWWDNQSLPLPANAIEVHREKRLTIGIEFVFVYYESTQDMSTIQEFYRQKLPALGWKETRILDQMALIPGLTGQIQNAAEAFSSLLDFTKDKQHLIVSFLPSAAAPDNKTRFTVSLGTIPENIDPAVLKNPIPQLIAKPKRDIAPVYPGATLISLSEQADASKIGYLATDDAQIVLTFYRNNMARYGWSLANEQPVTKMQQDNVAEQLGSIANCPSCADNFKKIGDIDMRVGALDFTNERQDTCKIVVSSAEMMGKGVAVAGQSKFTTILVRYNEKRK